MKLLESDTGIDTEYGKLYINEDVPFSNYGTAIAHINGILRRSLEIFPDLVKKVF